MHKPYVRKYPIYIGGNDMDKKQMIVEIVRLLNGLDTAMVRATYATLKKFEEAQNGRSEKDDH